MPPTGWQWDSTLYRGSAAMYERGRLPYPPGLANAVRDALALDGRGRLLDVGCGPGILALRLAHLFESVVGLDADADMLRQAELRAGELGVGNARWVRAMAEDLPLDLGSFRVVTFGQSFHWMDRDRVAALVFDMLEPDGAFVQVSAQGSEVPPHGKAIKQLLWRYLGATRRAGQGTLAHGTPGDELSVLRRAGYPEAQIVKVPGGQSLRRDVDDIVAMVHSHSGAAPHLFGDRLDQFRTELRALLLELQPSGEFVQQVPEAELRVWRRPAL